MAVESELITNDTTLEVLQDSNLGAFDAAHSNVGCVDVPAGRAPHEFSQQIHHGAGDYAFRQLKRDSSSLK